MYRKKSKETWPSFTSYININEFHTYKNLNVKGKIIKHVETNIEEYIYNFLSFFFRFFWREKERACRGGGAKGEEEGES